MAPPPPLSQVDVPAPPPQSREPSEDGFDGDGGDEPDSGVVDEGPAEDDRPPVVVGVGGPPGGDPPGGAPSGGAGHQERPPGAGSGVFDAEQWESTNEDNPTRIIRVQGAAGQHAPTRVIRGQGPAGGRGQV